MSGAPLSRLRLDPARVERGGFEYSDLSPLTSMSVNTLCGVSLAAFRLSWRRGKSSED